MSELSVSQYREFLKDTIRQQIDFAQTDQTQGIPLPALEKSFPADARRHDLTPVGKWAGVKPVDVATAIGNRRSHRSFGPEPLTRDELSFLLWATQGVRQQIGPGAVLRKVPSAGNRHALETYLAVLQSAAWNRASTATCRWSTNSCTCSTRTTCPRN